MSTLLLLINFKRIINNNVFLNVVERLLDVVERYRLKTFVLILIFFDIKERYRL